MAREVVRPRRLYLWVIVLFIALAFDAGWIRVFAATGAVSSISPAMAAMSGMVLDLTLRYDQQLVRMLQGPAGNPHWVMSALTELGGAMGVLVMHAVLYRQDPELARRSAQMVMATTAVTQALKFALGRERPDTDNAGGRFLGFSWTDKHHSMPSGHTAAAFAMADLLARSTPGHAAVYYGAAVTVGLSRVYLHRHWISDVVAGALIGLAVGQLI